IISTSPMTESKRYCLYCDKLLKGRSDQLYCDDACRNAYFNNKRKSEHQEIRSIDLILKKNRRILKELLGANEILSIPENKLLQKGFDFKYHTHFFRSLSGGLYWFCYDYGYLLKRSSLYVILKETSQIKNNPGS
ncbi:MAG TPA: hypothetical protein VKR53_00505, partial [Puia sp.]|nr:hypothetical protein [Puia sp.]